MLKESNAQIYIIFNNFSPTRGPKARMWTRSVRNLRSADKRSTLVLYYTCTNFSLFRDISAISVALLRVILHSIFVYTLQTRNMKNPTYITELVECTEPYSCTNYFSLHLIQDIRDVTDICNKTFEEAILIVHILIDHLLTVQPDTRMSVYIYVVVH